MGTSFVESPTSADMGPGASETPVVQVNQIHKNYGAVCALDGIDLTVNRGEFLTFLGPSGCGKTTLLRIVAGLERPSSGRIMIDGEDVTRSNAEHRPLNMVFQRYALFPHLNVFDNVAFGLRLKKVPPATRRTRVLEALELVRLSGFEQRMTNQLSGGQAQRVALARALVNEPKVLLLDEPLAALDRQIRQRMQAELREVHRRSGTTFVYVTHDQEEAMAMSDRIVLMNSGRIEQLAAPTELYRRPSSQFAGEFVGDANIVAAAARTEGGKSSLYWAGLDLGPSSGSPRDGEEQLVLLRPESLRLCDKGSSLPSVEGEIMSSTYIGFYWMMHVRVGQKVLDVRDYREWPDGPPSGLCQIGVDVARVVVLESVSAIQREQP